MTYSKIRRDQKNTKRVKTVPQEKNRKSLRGMKSTRQIGHCLSHISVMYRINEVSGQGTRLRDSQTIETIESRVQSRVTYSRGD